MSSKVRFIKNVCLIASMKHIRYLVVLMLGSIAQGQSQSSWVINGNLLDLSSVGNTGGYGTTYQVGFRSVSDVGVDGVFLPTPDGNGSIISSTGLLYKPDTSLVSVNPTGNSARSQWQNNPNATYETWTSSLDSYFAPKGINWAANSLFAHSNSGITYDLLEIGSSIGQNLSKFTTYFGNHCEPGNEPFSGDVSYAILLDGVLVSSERNFTALNPFSTLIEINLTANTRFLTLVVGDNGDDYNWDTGVFVAPTLITVPEPSSLSLLALGVVVVALRRRKK